MTTLEGNANISICTSIFRKIGQVGITIFLTSLCYWGLLNLYVYICTPMSIWGPFITIFTMGSPVCVTLNKLQMAIVDYYIVIWTSIGSALVTWIACKTK